MEASLGPGATSGSLVDLHMSMLERGGKTAVLASVFAAESGAAAEVANAAAATPNAPALALAVLGVADAPKPEARAVVRALGERMGLEVWMITGDNRVTALALAHEVGIAAEHVIAGALPRDKAEKVAALCDAGRGAVAFVGDGINDAVALKRATVGVALGAGSKIAVAAANVVLLKSDLWDVACALDLSKAVFRRIQLNFVWALGYNVLGLPIAAGLFFPVSHMPAAPEVAGLAMALSSVSVVLSSLMLQLYRRPRFTGAGSGGGNRLTAAAAPSRQTSRAALSIEEDESAPALTHGPASSAIDAMPLAFGGDVAVRDLSSLSAGACACDCANCMCNAGSACCEEGDGSTGGTCCGCRACRCAALRAPERAALCAPERAARST
jgi:soluble P-type ATPase